MPTIPSKTIVRKVGEAEITFRKLSLRDQFALCDQIRRRDKEALAESMRLAGVTDPAQIAADLHSLDEVDYYAEKFIPYVNTARGMLDVVERALDGKAVEGVESVEGGLLSLAAELCGMTVTAKGPESDKEGSPGEAYGEESPAHPTGPGPDTYTTPAAERSPETGPTTPT